LEIGCWQGSTLVSSLHGNAAKLEKALALDNFSEFGGPETELRKNIAAFLQPVSDRLTFVNADCWQYAPTIGQERFNVYLYDGPHLEQEQYDAFVKLDHALDDTFVALVDDYNWAEVSGGTQRAFGDLRYDVVKDWVLPGHVNADVENWWNGFYVAVVRHRRPM
jgi:hypothetical protein